MRLHVQTGYGETAKNIALVEQREPKPGPTDIVVAVHAASLNPIDYKIVHGLMRRKVMAAARQAGASYYGYLTESSGPQLEAIAALTTAGKLRAVIDRTFLFEDLAGAFAHLETGRAKGKVNLQVR
jgi:NADPH:quinone reductase-like Zn-dependent oxidoreductase